jgi:nucleoside-diphosphate-sugar epimerase
MARLRLKIPAALDPLARSERPESMSEKLNVITGATGLLGSHIAEQLRAQGERVRALVRPASDTSFLEQIGVELARGDLRDPASLRRTVAGANIVYHCAARVSDWGPWSCFQAETVEGARNLVEACCAEHVGRLLHASSISVFGIIKDSERPVDEDAPIGQKIWRWDYYARSKVLAECEARKFPRHTIMRPSWIYGPRDRVTIPRVVPALRSGRVPIIGSGDNVLNLIYAGDVADGAIRAANHPGAIGQVYHFCSTGEVTQRKLVDTLTDALQLPRISKHVPFSLAYRVAFLQEFFARLLRRPRPPRITRRAIYLIGRSTLYSSSRAREQLGWRPRIDICEGVCRALKWHFSQKTP